MFQLQAKIPKNKEHAAGGDTFTGSVYKPAVKYSSIAGKRRQFHVAHTGLREESPLRITLLP